MVAKFVGDPFEGFANPLHFIGEPQGVANRRNRFAHRAHAARS